MRRWYCCRWWWWSQRKVVVGKLLRHQNVEESTKQSRTERSRTTTRESNTQGRRPRSPYRLQLHLHLHLHLHHRPCTKASTRGGFVCESFAHHTAVRTTFPLPRIRSMENNEIEHTILYQFCLCSARLHSALLSSNSTFQFPGSQFYAQAHGTLL
jgi:hypothetical protein